MTRKTLFRCPNCSKALTQGEKQYFCPNGHSFDISKKGYVNLLLPAHTGAGDPGDSKEMLLSRREFLDRGYYETFSNALNDMIYPFLPLGKEGRKKAAILDAGCGEGYYISKLKNRLTFLNDRTEADIYGIDVSKPAIHYASGRDREIRFAVASNYHVPVLDSSLDCILCIFAPRDEKEFLRVLKPSGLLLVAAPGPHHLYSMRKLLYKDPEIIGLKGTVGEGFRLVKQEAVSYTIAPESSQDILNLFGMTPYSRHAHMAAVEKLKNTGGFTTEVDININLYRKV